MCLRLARNEVLSLQADHLCVARSRHLLVNVDVLDAVPDEVTSGSHTLTLLILALLLLGGTLLVDFLSVSELLTNFFLGGRATVRQPRMSDDVSDAEAHMRLLLQHARDQVHELGGEVVGFFALRVRLPEEVGPIRGNELIEAILVIGLREGRMPRPHDEEDDGKGEEIDDITLVGLA